MNILLIGAGKFGQNYINTISKSFNINLTVANRNNWKDLINNKPDGVIICTPPESHIKIASYALEQNIPCMIEKPLALSLEEAKKLADYSAPILVDHIHLYSVRYNKIKSLITDPSKLSYVYMENLNSSPNRDYSILWDFGCHEVAVILDLMHEMPNSINAELIKPVPGGEIIKLTLKYKACEVFSIFGNGTNKKKKLFSVDYDGMILSYDDTLKIENEKLPLEVALGKFFSLINYRPSIDYNRMYLNRQLQILDILELCEISIKNKSEVYL